jgi:hypothetical protein
MLIKKQPIKIIRFGIFRTLEDLDSRASTLKQLTRLL